VCGGPQLGVEAVICAFARACRGKFAPGHVGAEEEWGERNVVHGGVLPERKELLSTYRNKAGSRWEGPCLEQGPLCMEREEPMGLPGRGTHAGPPGPPSCRAVVTCRQAPRLNCSTDTEIFDAQLERSRRVGRDVEVMRLVDVLEMSDGRDFSGFRCAGEPTHC